MASEIPDRHSPDCAKVLRVLPATCTCGAVPSLTQVLADFERRPEVRATFAAIQSSQAFSLDAAHAAFAGTRCEGNFDGL